MKKLGLLILSLALLGTARAGLITPDGNLAAGNDSVAAMQTNLGISPLTLLFKIDFGDPEKDPPKLHELSGDYGAYFSVTGINFDDPDSTATVSWNLTGSGFELVGIVWKAGNGYLWSGIHADQYLIGGPHELSTAKIDLTKNPKDLSHISFYGRRGVTVPDSGASIGLLMIGLAALALARRK